MSKIEVFFATNRQPINTKRPTGFLERFSNAGNQSLRFGCATVKKKGNDYSVTNIEGFEESLTAARPVLGSETTFSTLHDRLRKGNEAIAFVHGFNVTFEAALEDAARMKDLYQGQGTNYDVLVFSWPSHGKIHKYLNDRSHARASGDALARALQKTLQYLRDIRADEHCLSKLHLIAHSMGNYVLRHAVQSVRNDMPRGILPQFLHEALLIAPDEDADAFSLDYKFEPLPQIARRVSVYMNKKDFALTLSDKAKFNPARLGQTGPSRPFDPPANVTTVDVTDVAQEITLSNGVFDQVLNELQQHRYHTYNEDVVADVKKVLRGVPHDQIKGKRKFVPSENRYSLRA